MIWLYDKVEYLNHIDDCSQFKSRNNQRDQFQLLMIVHASQTKVSTKDILFLSFDFNSQTSDLLSPICLMVFSKLLTFPSNCLNFITSFF